jgi:hemerythrin-like domain-containing protein
MRLREKEKDMRPTEILSSEHRVIEIGIDCLERISDEAIKEDKLDKASAEQAVDFIRNFADRCHHGKEENQLFALLEEKGMPADGGPTGQMKHEHEQGRAFVSGMADSIDEASDGVAKALAKFVQNAQNYIQLLRDHIKKEDHVLFPMADRMLDDDDQDSLKTAFDRVESEHMGVGTHDKYLRLVEALADKYGVSKAGLTGHSCGCGHSSQTAR